MPLVVAVAVQDQDHLSSRSPATDLPGADLLIAADHQQGCLCLHWFFFFFFLMTWVLWLSDAMLYILYWH